MQRVFLILSLLGASIASKAQNNPSANPLVWGINAASSPIQVGESTTTTFSIGNNGADPIPAGGAAFNVSFPPNVTVTQSSLNMDGGSAIFSASWTVTPGVGTFLKIDVVGSGIPAATFMGPQVRFDMTVTLVGAVPGGSQQQTLNAEFDASISQNLNPGDDNANGPIQVTAALPVTLTAFTGELTDRKSARLDWSVTGAVQFSHFELERSQDGTNFSKLKTIDFNGKEQYTQYDQTIGTLKDKVYYRLKMVDRDGNAKRSDVVALHLKSISQEIGIFPNPAENAITVKGFSGQATLEIYSIEGRLLQQHSVSGNEAILDVSMLAPGTYTVNIIDQSGKKGVKLIKK